MWHDTASERPLYRNAERLADWLLLIVSPRSRTAWKPINPMFAGVGVLPTLSPTSRPPEPHCREVDVIRVGQYHYDKGLVRRIAQGRGGGSAVAVAKAAGSGSTFPGATGGNRRERILERPLRFLGLERRIDGRRRNTLWSS